MPTLKSISVKKLKLDLSNFRTVKQKSESDAIKAMISISPDRFWALAESLMADGYHPTENIIILKNGNDLVVKEGNRRVALLKIISGFIKHAQFEFPENIKDKISVKLKTKSSKTTMVPCAVYSIKEKETVDKIVSLIHGKGEKAQREKWFSVATARHNRDEKGVSEPALDLLENYLIHGKNLNENQRERWAGDYPLTVLEEALSKIAPRMNFESIKLFVEQYPDKIKNKKGLENLLGDIGTETLGFKLIRDSSNDFGKKYGIPEKSSEKGDTPNEPGGPPTPPDDNPPDDEGGKDSGKEEAFSATDPKAVIKALKKFKPKGDHREKIVTLLKEARLLKIKKHPHSFCFLLRSMFELSAKAYCEDHKKTGGPSLKDKDGKDKSLVVVLKEIHKHLTNNDKDIEMKKLLHGTMAVIAEPTSFLSVTSMNQLIHSPDFLIEESKICLLFFNVFPFLKAMNQ